MRMDIPNHCGPSNTTITRHQPAGKTIQSITAGQKRKFHQYRNLIERQQRENMSRAKLLTQLEALSQALLQDQPSDFDRNMANAPGRHFRESTTTRRSKRQDANEQIACFDS